MASRADGGLRANRHEHERTSVDARAAEGRVDIRVSLLSMLIDALAP